MPSYQGVGPYYIKGNYMIVAENLTKIYDNGAKGIEHLSVRIEDGEFVFIVGSSGSGKTTLVKLLLREITPTDGRLIVNGDDITNLTHSQMPYYRRRMGVVFQDFRLLPNKTIYENVAFAMQIVGASNRDIRPHIKAWLSACCEIRKRI